MLHPGKRLFYFMKTEQTQTGKISTHFRGIGTVTREMVDARAREIARINGRQNILDSDWIQARQELQGIAPEPAEEEGVSGLKTWDAAPASSGERAAKFFAADEQTVAEQLVREGVDEATHDQMVEGSKNAQNQE